MKVFFPISNESVPGNQIVHRSLFCLIIFLSFFSIAAKAQPSISSFAPVSGPIGTSVTITGANFSANPADNIVFLGAVRAAVTSATSTSLTITVPAGATYQPLSVTVNKLTAFASKPFIVTFPDAQNMVEVRYQVQNTFDTPIDSTTGLHPNGIAIADFDNDGNPDVATANNYSINGEPASVSVLRNTGAGGALSFTSHQDIKTGVLTYAVAAFDLDGDGKPDLVSSSIADQSISIHKNTSTPGAISFATKIDYTTGNNPYSIAIADLDNDGKPDLAVAGYTASAISVFRNTSLNGNITFAPRVDILTGASPNAIIASDLDGDGKPDLAVTNEFMNTISLYRNTSTTGAISFAATTTYATGSKPFGIAAGDLDGDNKPDLAVTNSGTSTYSVFRNTGNAGTISFAAKADFNTGATPYGISIGDLNGDAKPDVVVAAINSTFAQNTSTVGNISFATQIYLWLGRTSFYIGISDFTADGRNDLACANFTSESVSLLRNKNNEPTISDISPSTAAAGATVTITGYNLSGVTALSIGGVPVSSFTIVNSTTISAVVGSGATGQITATNKYGTTTSKTVFTFAGPPVVQSFSPTVSGQGMTVAITGQNFTNATAVKFGGTNATSYTIVSPTVITAVVGAGATGNVSVTTSYGTGTAANFTWVTIPKITSFTPAVAGTDSIVTLTGSNFTTVTAITFGGIPAASFSIINTTTIKAVVGSGATGKIAVTDPVFTADIDGFTYAPAPNITSFTPLQGIAGDEVTLTGTNFIGVSNVKFGGIDATSFTVPSSTTIKAIVSGGGASGDISIVTTGGKTSIPGFTFIPPPVITGFSPASGPVGTTVTITGINFSATPANNIVYFGAVRATVTAATTTSLTVIVPASADHHSITVTSNKLTACTNEPFIVTFPDGPATFTTSSFATRKTVYSNAINDDIFVIDVDGDGKPDIVTPDWAVHSVSIIRNTGTFSTISFAPPVKFDVSWYTNNITMGDVDGDGKPDLAISSGDYSINILKNSSTPGNISFTTAAIVPTNNLFNATRMQLKDIDGDGRPDLTVLAGGSNSVWMYIYQNISGNGTISFSTPIILPAASTYYSNPEYADLDGDKKPELLFTISGTTISIYKNKSIPGTISFDNQMGVNVTTNYPQYTTAGDLDGDGKSDLVITYGNYIGWKRNTTTGGVISFDALQIAFPSSGLNKAVLADLDGDGKPDIIERSGGPNGVDQGIYIRKNQSVPGTISFSATAAYPVKMQIAAGAVAVCDLNGDSKPDLISTEYGQKTISVFTNLAGAQLVNACPGGNLSLVADKTGTNYQWQLNTGNGFSNLSNNSTYSAVTTQTLQITNLPVNYNGYNYRCLVDGNNSIISILEIEQIFTPVIAVQDNTISISIVDTACRYTWQLKNGAGVWNDITPAATDTSFKASVSGNYRIKATKGTCVSYSNEQVINIPITAILPVQANDMGIHVYPNPVTTTLIIDSLKLFDHWQSLEIFSTDGKQTIKPISIKNHTKFLLPVNSLKNGLYMAILKRTTGAPVLIRFIKQ
ncbi:hypothetical protein A3860_32960 [Niastella vici]|uniref:IPT/TIG domain-containing protein n=1 Tax=Niastella vici TaxID=1703345 RepID=A0A1V9FQH7_9BACT|nr:FG-GAP-like repeat-containing protein [Niastella vici]OQP60625.1 hypothetical protein A3860_32960 [Niastella vici]